MGRLDTERAKPIAIATGIVVIGEIILGVFGWYHLHIAGVRFTDSEKTWAAYGLLILLALVSIVCAYLWSIAHPSGRMVADIGLFLSIGCVVQVFLIPYLSDLQYLHHHHYLHYLKAPFLDGAGDFFLAIWLYFGVGIAGTILGVLIAMAFGKDYRSQQLRRFVENSKYAAKVRPVKSGRR